MRLLALAALCLAAAGPAAAQDVAVSSGGGAGYSWTLTLPRTGLEQADAAMDAWARGRLAEFLSITKDARVGQPGTWEFILTSSTFPRSGDTLSARLDAWSYAGGAHGNTQSESFVFERASGRRLLLADLFKPGSKYLEALSRLAEPALKRSLGQYGDPQWVRRGAGPEAENYGLFALAGDRLLLFFPTYQVGPYVAGSQTVRLRLSALKGVLRPEFAGLR